MMVKKSANPSGSTKEGLEVELSGLFGTLGNAVDLLGKLTEAGVKHLQHQDEFTLNGRGGQGADRIERFGNIHATTEGVVVDDVHEPLVDVFDEGTEIVVTVELPGARENEIKVEQRDALLAIESQGERRYAKEVLLPGAIDGNSLQK